MPLDAPPWNTVSSALLSAQAPIPAKRFVCENLSVIGSARGVPVLAELLPDRQLSHAARVALERIPGPQAGEALRSALPHLAGRLKIGVINSLGTRRDRSAAGPLTKLLNDADREISAAAAAALASLGTIESVRGLREFSQAAAEAQQEFVVTALLTGAERLAQQGHDAEAAEIFRQYHSSAYPASIRLTAFIGLLEAQADARSDLISRALAGDDDEERSVVARMISRGPKPAPLERFISEFQGYPLAGQLAVLDACRVRADAEGRTAALNALRTQEPRLRLAALRTLAAIGRAEDLSALLRFATEGSEEEKLAACSGLAAIPDKQLDAAMARQLGAASPEAQLVLIQALAARGATEASRAVGECLANSSEVVREAALEALSAIGGVDEAPAIIHLLRSTASRSLRENARTTLQAVADRVGPHCAPPVLAALKDARGTLRPILLQILGTAAGDQALEYLRAAVRDPDPAASEAALRVLADWTDREAASELLRLARTCDNPNLSLLAFRGYVRLCGAEPNAGERHRLLAEALGLAQTVAHKRLVIQALGDSGSASSAQALEPFFDDPDLIEVTSLAVVTMAANADVQDRDALRPALRKVAQRSANDDMAERARKLLHQLEPVRK